MITIKIVESENAAIFNDFNHFQIAFPCQRRNKTVLTACVMFVIDLAFMQFTIKR